MRLEMTQELLDKNKYFRLNLSAGKDKMEFDKNPKGERLPQGLVLHSIGAQNPFAQAEQNKFNAEDKYPVHGILEPGLVIQCMPWNFKGLHVKDPVNKFYLGVEMTEPAGIVYPEGKGACWTYNKEKVKAKDGKTAEDAMKEITQATSGFVGQTYETAVVLFAMLCHLYNLNPLGEILIKTNPKATPSELYYKVVTSHVETLMLGMNLCEEKLIQCNKDYSGKKSAYCTRHIVKCAKDQDNVPFDQLKKYCDEELIRCNEGVEGREYCDESLFTCTSADAKKISGYCDVARVYDCGVSNFDFGKECQYRLAPCGKAYTKDKNGIKSCAHRAALCGENSKTCGHRRTECGELPEFRPDKICGTRLKCSLDYNKTCDRRGRSEKVDPQNPAGPKIIIDPRDRCTGSNHADPLHLWDRINMYPNRPKRLTMDGFRRDVAEAMKTTTIYYVAEVADNPDLDVILGKKIGGTLSGKTGAPGAKYRPGYLLASNSFESAVKAAETANGSEAKPGAGSARKKYIVCYYSGTILCQYDPGTQKIFQYDTTTGVTNGPDSGIGDAVYGPQSLPQYPACFSDISFAVKPDTFLLLQGLKNQVK